MPALIASLAAALVATVLCSLLLRRSGARQDVSGRIMAYLAIGRRDKAGPVKREAGLRGLWQALGKMAPKGLSQHYGHVLQQASLPIKGEEMAGAIGFSTLLGIALGGLLLKAPGWFIGGFIGARLPDWLLRSYLKRRLKQVEEQLVDFMTLCANALRAGQSFQQSLELAAREMPNPMGLELGRTLRELSLGLSVEDALLRLVDRVPSADLDLLITAVLIQRQVGGDLAGILDNIAATIRERQRIKAQVQTITAQGRLSGWVISLLPVALALVLNSLNPGYIRLLWTNPIGLGLLGFSAVSMTMGIYFINKLIKIDI